MNTANTTADHPGDILTIALILAAMVHAALLLGISFTPYLDAMRTPPALEVVLVQQNLDEDTVDDAAFLAQSNQQGGGNNEEDLRPSSPFSSPVNIDSDGIAPTPIVASAPTPTEASSDDIITALNSEEEVAIDESAEEQEKISEVESPIVTDSNAEIAKLAAEIDRQQEEFAKRPKKKFLNARTRESAAAEYMYRWVESVERMGNLNYPDEARREQLHGELILIVGIHKNGELESITVDESSGHKVLDDAAVRIVEMAAPFAPMTGELAEETDILYIVRTWEFTAKNSVDSR